MSIREAWGRSVLRLLPLVALAVLAAGCESDDDLVGPGGGSGVPTGVRADYRWVFEEWVGDQPRGFPAVEVSWELPARWDGEVFRVYGRRAGQRDYFLLATVTSCAGGLCRYTDVNIEPGSTYQYFVTAFHERSGLESDGSTLESVDVPAATVPQPPAAPRAVALDGAVYLQWAATGAERYWVLLESDDGAEIFDVGETDGVGFLDTRAENGTRYRYRVAAVDGTGRVSALGPVRVAIPRPDHQAELIYAFADSAAASGFQFVVADSLDPIVPGTASGAQLRLEVLDGALSLVPLGTTAITSGVLTTALTCGPGSDPGCFAIHATSDPDAPTDFASTPVTVAPELTYLVRVRGADGRTRYGKIRIALEGADQDGRDLAVFDWAYQLVPDEPSLGRR